MHVNVPVADARRIGVIANALLLWQGPQLALAWHHRVALDAA